MAKTQIKILLIIIISILFSDLGNCTVAPKNKLSGTQIKTADSSVKKDTAVTNVNPPALPIDTAAVKQNQIKVTTETDTVRKLDSMLTVPDQENAMTNTKLFTYILLTVLGSGLFFFIFVINLFKTFHKKKSTRQSLLLSWSLFFIISIIWIFIVWGLIAGFWTSASFMVVVIFLFIISLIMTIIAVKSK